MQLLPLKNAHLLSTTTIYLIIFVASFFKCALITQGISTADTAAAVISSSNHHLHPHEQHDLLHHHVQSYIAEEKIPAEQLECFADYLVQVKGAKTEIFAEKDTSPGILDSVHWENAVYLPPVEEKWQWRMKRAVVRQPKTEQLRVYDERKMANESGKEDMPQLTDECFTNAHQQGKGTVKFVNIKELFDSSANGRLRVSDGLNKRLEKQSECLVDFLTRNFGVQYLYEEDLAKKTAPIVHRRTALPGKNSSRDIAVLEAHSVMDGETSKKLFRWKWSGEKKMPKIRFKEGTVQFSALTDCEKIVPLKNTRFRKKDRKGKLFIVLNPLLARFRGDQLFVREMPKTINNFTLGHTAMLKQKRCIICQAGFAVGDELAQFYHPCRHIFHHKCLEGWLDQKETCPICRAKVDLDFGHRMSKDDLRAIWARLRVPAPSTNDSDTDEDTTDDDDDDDEDIEYYY